MNTVTMADPQVWDLAHQTAAYFVASHELSQSADGDDLSKVERLTAKAEQHYTRLKSLTGNNHPATELLDEILEIIETSKKTELVRIP